MAQREVDRAFAVAAGIVRPPLRLLARHEWSGGERLPRGTGFVLAANHVSNLDPVTLADFVLAQGLRPSFLAKASLFTAPVVGAVMRGTGQVPVLRGTADAQLALAAGEQRVRDGGCVVVYPDGTLTRDPLQWPMVGKSGAARTALATGCPVVPVAQWGAHLLLPPPGSPSRRPQLRPRPRLQVLVGEPVDLTAWRGLPLDAAVLAAATAAVVDAVVRLLEQLRGEGAPARWDPRTGARRAVGG